VRASSLVQQQAYHYVIDCIDSVAPKHALLLAGHEAGEQDWRTYRTGAVVEFRLMELAVRCRSA
jgi:hypothetical protein